MLTKTEAASLVQCWLDSLDLGDDAAIIVVESTIERSFGWVFFYQSKKYIETRTVRYRLAGNGPVIVNRATGNITHCSSNGDVQSHIADYERSLGSGHT